MRKPWVLSRAQALFSRPPTAAKNPRNDPFIVSALISLVTSPSCPSSLGRGRPQRKGKRRTRRSGEFRHIGGASVVTCSALFLSSSSVRGHMRKHDASCRYRLENTTRCLQYDATFFRLYSLASLMLNGYEYSQLRRAVHVTRKSRETRLVRARDDRGPPDVTKLTRPSVLLFAFFLRPSASQRGRTEWSGHETTLLRDSLYVRVYRMSLLILGADKSGVRCSQSCSSSCRRLRNISQGDCHTRAAAHTLSLNWPPRASCWLTQVGQVLRGMGV